MKALLPLVLSTVINAEVLTKFSLDINRTACLMNQINEMTIYKHELLANTWEETQIKYPLKTLGEFQIVICKTTSKSH